MASEAEFETCRSSEPGASTEWAADIEHLSVYVKMEFTYYNSHAESIPEPS